MIDHTVPDWHADGACRGMDANLWFPRAGESIRLIRLAQSICSACPVQPECLDYAVSSIEPFGIWGGLTERQRRQLRKVAV
jgi:WhiB family redox-sensing transcriptional regulator